MACETNKQKTHCVGDQHEILTNTVNMTSITQYNLQSTLFSQLEVSCKMQFCSWFLDLTLKFSGLNNSCVVDRSAINVSD